MNKIWGCGRSCSLRRKVFFRMSSELSSNITPFREASWELCSWGGRRSMSFTPVQFWLAGIYVFQGMFSAFGIAVANILAGIVAGWIRQWSIIGLKSCMNMANFFSQGSTYSLVFAYFTCKWKDGMSFTDG